LRAADAPAGHRQAEAASGGGVRRRDAGRERGRRAGDGAGAGQVRRLVAAARAGGGEEGQEDGGGAAGTRRWLGHGGCILPVRTLPPWAGSRSEPAPGASATVAGAAATIASAPATAAVAAGGVERDPGALEPM